MLSVKLSKGGCDKTVSPFSSPLLQAINTKDKTSIRRIRMLKTKKLKMVKGINCIAHPINHKYLYLVNSYPIQHMSKFSFAESTILLPAFVILSSSLASHTCTP